MTESAEEKIFIIGTHGPEDPERALFPFVIANAALAMDVGASIALQGVAVMLAQKGVAEHVFAAGLPPLKDLMDSFFAQGGKLLVCTPCVKERQLSPETLIDEAELIAGARAVQEGLEAKAVYNY